MADFVAERPSWGSDKLTLLDQASHGVAKAHVLAFAQDAHLSVTDLAELVGVSLRTFHRWKDDSLLGRAESEQFLALAAVFAQGRATFGTDERFQLWLKAPSVALGGRTPFALLPSRFGLELVVAELVALDHGVFS